MDVTVTTTVAASTTNAADHYTYTVTPASLIPLGVYPPAGGGDPASIASYAQATGTNPTLALDFGDKTDGWAGMDSASTMIPWSGSGYRLVMAVPIIPTNSSGTAQGTLATGATGAYNQYFTTLGQNLVPDGALQRHLATGVGVQRELVRVERCQRHRRRELRRLLAPDRHHHAGRARCAVQVLLEPQRPEPHQLHARTRPTPATPMWTTSGPTSTTTPG